MKDFTLRPEASELKEIGFDEPCVAFYNHNGQLLRYMNPDKDWNSLNSQLLKNSNITIPDTYTAPTYSQAFRFFRENHNIDGFVRIEPLNEKYGFVVYNRKKENFIEYKAEYNLPEEAEDACINLLLLNKTYEKLKKLENESK